MRIRVLSVGKPKAGAAAALYDEYAGRIERLGIPCEAAWVPEVKPGGRYTDEHVREREARSLIAALGDGGSVIALDRTGALLDTEKLAGNLERWTTPRGTFVIGGPLGLHPSVLARADRVWSLSPLTFPHELARAMLAEQLYRAVTLLRGIPYHK